MSKPRIGVVVHAPLREQIFTREDMKRLEALGEVAWTDRQEKLSAQDAIKLLADCRIAIGSWGTPSPKSEGLLDACPKLRLWIHAAGSVKRMFGPHLEGRRLTIASCAPAIAEQVAETTVGELIVGVRRILENAAANRKGRAPTPANVAGLGESTIGLVGASQVGRRVIRNLKPFGPRILLYDPYVSEEEAKELGVELRRDLTGLCAEADALTIHAPANPDCHKMIGPEQLKAMKDDCVIVNTARGVCIDEAALAAELEKGRFFAFLDVSDPEPAAEDSPLRRLPNVVYTSHIAGGPTVKIGAQIVRDVKAWIEGKPLMMAVTPDMLERIA